MFERGIERSDDGEHYWFAPSIFPHNIKKL